MRILPKNKRDITPRRCCATCKYVRVDTGIGFCQREADYSIIGIFPDDTWDYTNLEHWYRTCDRWAEGK